METAQERKTRAILVGDNLRRIRRANGMTQAAVAEKLQTRNGAPLRSYHYCEWENGRHEPSEEKLKRLAEIFRCDLSDFYAPDTP